MTTPTDAREIAERRVAEHAAVKCACEKCYLARALLASEASRARWRELARFGCSSPPPQTYLDVLAALEAEEAGRG